MLGLFGAISSNVPIQKKISEPTTDGIVNRLHYRVTFIFLLGSSLLVTCLDYIGNGSKINCVLEGAVDSWTIAQNVINTYCYVLTTFTVPNHYNSKIGEDSAQFGVGAFNPDKDKISYKAYYQWVPFVLFLQAMMFYLPHSIFKAWEGGKVRAIIAGLNTLILDPNSRKDKERVLADYFVESLHSHNFWAMKMLFIEFLNLINVIGNIYFVDVFLGGEFSTYGTKVLNFLEADPEQRIDPMATVFPRVTKCSFYKYGPSGTVQTHDSICVLPINIINEKIYVFLWFWLIILSAATVLSLIYHIFMMISPVFTKIYVRARAMNQTNLRLDDMGRHFEIGDWKLLYLLSKNMEPLVLGEFLRELYRSMKDKSDKASKPLMT